VIAHASIAVAGTRLTRIRSAPPLAFRETPEGLYLVGAAAGPLGGDRLTIDIDITGRGRLTVRTAAASVVLPGEKPSLVAIHARIGPDCELRWRPEPTVLARRCRHRIETSVELAPGACLEWWEELVLGRHGEPSGSASTRMDVDLDGAPLFRQEIAVGPDHPASASPAVLGAGARAVGSVLLAGPGLTRRSVLLGEGAAVLPLDGRAAQVSAVAADALSLRRSLACGVDGQAGSAAVHR